MGVELEVEASFTAELERAYCCLDRLALHFCFHVVHELGFSRAGAVFNPKACGVAPEGGYLLLTVLDILSEEGYVAQEGENWRMCRTCPDDASQELQREAREQCPGALPILELLERCRRQAVPFLSGRQPGLNVVFPRGDTRLWERVQCEDMVMSLYADLIPPVLTRVLDGRNKRLLEIGGGMGGVLRRCLPLVLERGVAEYRFTDLGRLFVERMERAHREQSPLRFAVVDIDLPLAPQGIEPDGFDAIIGVNVVHAAKNLDFTLRELRGALRQGGHLLLGEGSPPQPGKRWRLDLIFAFLRGWWDVTLDVRWRPRPGFLFPSEWLEWFRICAYRDGAALPGEHRFREACRGGLLTARRGEA